MPWNGADFDPAAANRRQRPAGLEKRGVFRYVCAAAPVCVQRRYGELRFVIRTGPHLKQAREALGWTPVQLARALRLAGGDKQGEKRVLEMESGRRDISGPVTVAVESFLHGYLPVGFTPEGEMAEAEGAQR
jgi:hypothetical protein